MKEAAISTAQGSDGVTRYAPRRVSRPAEGRVFTGVAQGLAEHLDLSATQVRIAFLVLSVFGGFGVVLYAVLWVVIPTRRAVEDGRPAPTRRFEGRGQALAIGAVAVGLVLLLRGIGILQVDALVWPVAIVAIGAALIWRQADESQRVQLTRATGRIPSLLTGAGGTRSAVLRLAAGAVLVAAGIAAFLAVSHQLTAARNGIVATVVVLVGLTVITGPWWWRLVGELSAERRERIRSQERAELAAHLHDSVLQTLALIQRQSESPREVQRLARGQERELRTWLYRPADAEGTRFGAAMSTVAAEVEDAYGVAVESVVVGDADLDPRTEALVQSAREALVNAAKHSGVGTMSLYAEVEPDSVTVFVRDRGVGFDPDAVAGDRHGVAGSIVGRMKRHGGTATIRSTPGDGTEVELTMTRTTKVQQ